METIYQEVCSALEDELNEYGEIFKEENINFNFSGLGPGTLAVYKLDCAVWVVKGKWKGKCGNAMELRMLRLFSRRKIEDGVIRIHFRHR